MPNLFDLTLVIGGDPGVDIGATGGFDANNTIIPNVSTPVANTDAANKEYVDLTTGINSVLLDATVDQVFFTVIDGAINIEFGWDFTASQPYIEELATVNNIKLKYRLSQNNLTIIREPRILAADVPMGTRTYFNGIAIIATPDPIFDLDSSGIPNTFNFSDFSTEQSSETLLFSVFKVTRFGAKVGAIWDFRKL